MSQHEDFLEGFGDALGLSDPRLVEAHYLEWVRWVGMSEIELIDLETCGYETGLEAGSEYLKQLGGDR